MNLKKGAVVAVVDGEKLILFKNTGDANEPRLTALKVGDVDMENMSGGARHGSSAANPDDQTQNEDAFAAGAAAILNKQVLNHHIDDLVVIAAPRTLGELRKHFHKQTQAAISHELAKTLTGQSPEKIVAALQAA